MELPDENIESWRRKPYVYQRPKTNMPKLGSNRREIHENHSKNNRKIAQEFDKIKEMLDMKTANVNVTKAKKEKVMNPVSKLSEALK